jgi:hypothetical protein
MHDGSEWLPEVNIAPEIYSSGTPTIAVDNFGHAHVAWYRAVALNRLHYMMFDGTQWGPLEKLAAQRDIYGMTMAADNTNKIHLTWHDQRYLGNYEIYYRRFNGLQWEPEVRLTNHSLYSHTSSVAVDDSGNVHVAWADKRDSNNEIYYKMFDGLVWGSAIRLTRAEEESKHPSIAVGADGVLHMIWRDARDGNQEIYYKRRDPSWLAGIGESPGAAVETTHLRILPNPVQTSAAIEFYHAAGANAVIEVYSITGRLVWKQDLGFVGPGLHRFGWKANDSRGERVAPGVYLLRVFAGERSATAKLMVLR